MLEKLMEAVRGKPMARVVVVELVTGSHDCFELRAGSFLLLEAQGDSPAVARVGGSKALKRALGKAREQIDEVAGRLDVAIESNQELANTVQRQGAVFAAVLDAGSLEEAKARALWAQNPVM